MEYTIRQTEARDLDGILELIKEFHEETLNDKGVTCDVEIANELMPRLIDTSLVLEYQGRIVGVIAGQLTHHVVNKEPLMQEIIWYVTKNHRRNGIKLYRAFEHMCERMGIKHLVMVNISGAKDEMFERFYKSEGFELLEIQYIKKLEG